LESGNDSADCLATPDFISISTGAGITALTFIFLLW
jgi:hypothetical protein